MRTRLIQFAVILFASAGFLWSQATPATPAAPAAPAAPTTPEAVPSAPTAPEVVPSAPTAPEVVPSAPTPTEKPAVEKPASEKAAESAPGVTVQGTEPVGTGASRTHDTLSVDFPEEDIRTILRNVADLFELNLVIPETLQGKTSIKLRDVTWRQIFEVILTPVGYTYIEQGSIIKVVSLESLAQEPVNTEIFTLSYARAAEAQPVIATLVDTSAGGKLVIDARSNSLIITERPSKMNRIRPIVERLDKATDQVMIESKFVEVTNSDIKNLGVNWASLDGYKLSATGIKQTWDRGRTQNASDGYNNNAGSTNGTNNGTTNGTTNSLTNTTTTQTNTGSQLLPVTFTDANGNTSTSYQVVPINSSGTTVSNSVGNGTTGSITGTITSGTTNVASVLGSLTNTAATSRLASAVFGASEFDVILSALNTLTGTKIVSNPTVVTLNNTEAFINVGAEYPIPNYTYNQEHGSFEVSGFNYKPIGIILKVTPQVNARGFIKLTLEPEVSQQNGTVSFGGAAGASIPIIATRKAKTQVSMKDGYTMAIGGLLRTQTSHGGTKVPVLGDIPVLGRLFSSKTKDLETTNLIIFITAKAISAEGASPEEIINPHQLRDLNLRRDELPGYRESADPFLPAEQAQAAPPVKS